MPSRATVCIVLALMLLAPLASLAASVREDAEFTPESPASELNLSAAQIQALATARTSGRATAQNWLHHVGGIGSDMGIVTRLGPAGTLYIAGNICHGAGTCSAIFGSTTIYANNDIFVAKLARNGTWMWIAQSTGSGSNPYAELDDMEIDQYGNAFIVGHFRYTKSFGSNSITPYQYNSNEDAFVARLSSQGAWSWAARMGGASTDYSRGIALDSNQNIYVVGDSQLYYGSSTYRNAYFGGYSFSSGCTSSQWRWNGFLTKLNPSGSFLWADRMHSQCQSDVYTRDVVVDGNAVPFVTGYFQNTLYAGGSSVTSTGSWDIFLGKASPSASSWDWLIVGGGLSSDYPQRLAVDSNNDIYIVGYNSNHASYGATIILANSGGFVVKTLANGTWEWGTRISPNYDVKDIAIHANGGVYVIGDRYLHHLNTTGSQQWYLSTSQTLASLDIDSNGTAFITGYFSSSRSFENFYLTNNGSNDLFIWRWDRDRDSDTVADRLDNCPDNWNTNQDDYDGDTEGDACDTDDDDDGFLDVVDNCPTGDMNWLSNLTTDRDQDGCQDAGEDVDDDDDGIDDADDVCHPSGQLNWTSYYATDHDSDGCHDDLEDGDDDNDGVPDVLDSCSKGALDWRSTPSTDHDSDGCEDASEDLDDDDDGLEDWSDECDRGDINWVSNASSDWDGDGCQDSGEDDDDDSDGALDSDDLCPRGVRDWTRYVSADYDDDGCRDSDEDGDDDNDGVVDHRDLCLLGRLDWTSNASSDNDGDGCHDMSEDEDDDNDRISDVNDFCSQGDTDWISGRVTDHDSDGCNDNREDTDDDNDGIPDVDDLCPRGMLGWTSNGGSDMDGDGCLDSSEDGDDDGDGVSDRTDPCPYDDDLQCVSALSGGNVTIVHQYPDNSSAANATTPPTSTVIHYSNNSTTVIQYYNYSNTTEVTPPDQPDGQQDNTTTEPATEGSDQTPAGGLETADLMALVSAGSLMLIALLMLLTMLQLRKRNNEENEHFTGSPDFASEFEFTDDQPMDDMLDTDPSPLSPESPPPESLAESVADLDQPEVGPDVTESADVELDTSIPDASAVGSIGDDGLEWVEHPEGSGSFFYRENADSDWNAWSG